MATLGSVKPFEISTGDWASYASRMDRHMKADKNDAELQTATMLTVVGGSTFNLLCDLPALDDLAVLKKRHCLIIGERYCFYQCDCSGESIAAYGAELRCLSRPWEFGDHLKEVLRDRIGRGLRSAATRRKLLASSGLEFDKAETDTKEDALAARHTVEVSADGTKQRTTPGVDGLVHSIRPCPSPRGKPQKYGNKPQPTHPCFQCGGTGHSPDSCRFIDTESNRCRKCGQLQKVCRSKPVQKPRRQHASIH